jgi:hypothetical protein
MDWRVGGRGSAFGRAAPAIAGPGAGRDHATLLPEDRIIQLFRLAAILAAQLFDFATFTIMVRLHGIDAELNPLVAQGFERGGFPVLFVVKVALVVLVGATIVILGRDAAPRTAPARLASFITVVAVCAGAFGGFSNAITI